MKEIILDNLKIVGISVDTTNQDERSAKDVMELWQKLYVDNVSSKIIDKTDNNIYCIYTDYETDYTLVTLQSLVTK